MAILEKDVLVSVGVPTDKHYANLGYNIPKNERGVTPKGTKIKVRVEDLPPRSTSIKLTKVCDICGRHVTDQTLDNILKTRSSDKLDYCHLCGVKKGIKKRDRNLIDQNKDRVLSVTYPEIAKILEDPSLGMCILPKSNKKYNFVCPKCNLLIKNKVLSSIVERGLTCPRCSDGISYPEKFLTGLLSQLTIEYEYQKSFEWSEGKRYDFYVESKNLIIETHGEQHFRSCWIDLQEIQNNDDLKMQLAKNHGIVNYIVLDCSDSNLEYIKSNIEKSELNRLFVLDSIDWLKCHKYACSSLIEDVCDLWNEYRDIKTISKTTKLSDVTISSYLKKGRMLGWCDYDPIKYQSEQVKKKLSKGVVCLSIESEEIGKFSSMREASEVTGVKADGISKVCSGKRKTAGGYKWMYTL